MTRALLLLALVTTASADDKLSDRKTAIAGFGITVMQIDGTPQMGMSLQPTFTRTFDRFETQVDYLLADLRDEADRMPGALLHRIGFAARYQALRKRVDREMTLDFVVEGGIGFQYIELDNGDVLGRNDLSAGIGLRMLTALPGRSKARGFIGMEAILRVLVSPSGDKAFVAAFGVPFGR